MERIVLRDVFAIRSSNDCRLLEGKVSFHSMFSFAVRYFTAYLLLHSFVLNSFRASRFSSFQLLKQYLYYKLINYTADYLADPN